MRQKSVTGSSPSQKIRIVLDGLRGKSSIAELCRREGIAEGLYWGRRGMRYPASEKLEIIRLVEQSHLPVRRTLATLGILPGNTAERRA